MENSGLDNLRHSAIVGQWRAGAISAFKNKVIHDGDEGGRYIAEFDTVAVRYHRDRKCWGSTCLKPGTPEVLIGE